MSFDIERLAEIAEKKDTADSVLSFLDEANKAISKIDSIISTFQKWGLSPSIVEKIAIKYGELDKVPSLPESKNLVAPASNTHRQVFEYLNSLSESQLVEISKKMTAEQK